MYQHVHRTSPWSSLCCGFDVFPWNCRERDALWKRELERERQAGEGASSELDSAKAEIDSLRVQLAELEDRLAASEQAVIDRDSIWKQVRQSKAFPSGIAFGPGLDARS